MFEKARTSKPHRGWLWLSVGVIAFALLITPVIRPFYLQSKAGKLIRDYVVRLEASTTKSIKGNFYCLLPSFFEMPKSDELDDAIELLRAAPHRFPENGHINLLLGQAYCLKQEYKQAVDAFDGFLAQRPENLLAKAESGFAEISLAQSTSDPQNAQIYLIKGLQSLEEAGFSNNPFIKLGDESFRQEKYQDALFWYEISDSISGLQGVTSFRYELLKLVFKGYSPYADQIKNGMILELARGLPVEPTSFFELSTGSAFQTAVYDGKAIVTLASNGQHAGILLKVMEANRFCFSILALDKPPQPTQIGVEVDFETFATTELVNGDGEWVQFDFAVDLDQGFHILAVKLMNDLYIAGEIDRNAYIGPVTIKACLEE